MPKYVKEGESIEGKRIYCEFESRPSFGIGENTKRETVTTTGNPAVATIMKTWKLKT